MLSVSKVINNNKYVQMDIPITIKNIGLSQRDKPISIYKLCLHLSSIEIINVKSAEGGDPRTPSSTRTLLRLHHDQ